MGEVSLGLLQEHQGPENVNVGGTTPGYHPDSDTQKTIKMVEGLYNKAKGHRKRYDQHWQDFYKAFRGKQWKEVRPQYRHSEVINLVWQTIQSMIPILTDSRPKLEFLPTIPSQFELADILTKVAENDWVHNNWLQVLCEVLLDGHIVGNGFGYCGFDPKANKGLGNVLFESADYFYMFPDPNAWDINDRRCKYVIYAEPVDVADLKKKYPDQAQWIKPDIVDLGQGDKTELDQIIYQSPVQSRVVVEGANLYDNLKRDQALVLTAYYLDDAYEELEAENGTPDGDDQKPKMIQKLKYPNGRKIVTVGGVLCEDGPAEFEDGEIPFIKYDNYILPREFWCVGDVEPIWGPQKTLNKLVSFTLDIITLMGNPIWKVGTQANIDTDNLFNKPGLIVEADDIGQVAREPGIAPPAQIFEFINIYKSFIDGISGENESSRGATPNDVTAAAAISALQEAQQTRLRMKSRNMDAFLQKFGKMYLSRVFQYYSLPRIIRVSGDAGAAKYFSFHVEKLEQPDGSTKQFANITNFDPETKQMVDCQKIEITADFDVRVSTGSTLPFARTQKQNVSMNLFKLGVIDDEELLKDMEYPNYEAVIQRVNAKKAAMAQQQAMAQAQGAPPPPH